MTNNKYISASTSITLDSLRIVAAFVVLISHAVDQWLPAYPDTISLLNNLAHAAVIVFFVLSGYLISYTTNSNNRGSRQYAVARLSRLYSVVLPAILITILIEVLVSNLDPSLASYYSRGSSIPRYILSLFFCNEVSFLSASPIINGPLWSLSYEFWYYTIFGLWFYRKAYKNTLIILCVVCLFVGPKILLLMPIWICGYLAYRLPKPLLSNTILWLCIFTLLGTVIGLSVYLPDLPYALGHKPFFYSNRFIVDIVIGVIFALAIWLLPLNSHNTNVNIRKIEIFRFIADLSFPLYILHFPLLVLWRALFIHKINNIPQMITAIIAVTLLSSLIGFLLDKQRGIWIRFFKWIFAYIKARNIKLPTIHLSQ